MLKKEVITHLILGVFLILFSIVSVIVSYFIIRDNNLDKTQKNCLIIMNVILPFVGLFFLIIGLINVKKLEKD